MNWLRWTWRAQTGWQPPLRAADTSIIARIGEEQLMLDVWPTLPEKECLAQEGKGGTELCGVADTVQEAAEDVRQRMQQAAVSAEGGDAEAG